MEQVLDDLIPTMTSDTKPSGTVVYSSQVTTGSGHYGYQAFDKITDAQHQWATLNSGKIGDYIGYIFDSPKTLYKIKVITTTVTSVYFKFKLQYTDDKTNWIDTNITGKTSSNMSVSVSGVGKHLGYRLYQTNSLSDTSNIFELYFYGRN